MELSKEQRRNNNKKQANAFDEKHAASATDVRCLCVCVPQLSFRTFVDAKSKLFDWNMPV